MTACVKKYSTENATVLDVHKTQATEKGFREAPAARPNCKRRNKRRNKMTQSLPLSHAHSERIMLLADISKPMPANS